MEMTFPLVIPRFLSAREKDDHVRGTYPKVLVPGGGEDVCVTGSPSLYGYEYSKHRIMEEKYSLWDFEGSKV